MTRLKFVPLIHMVKFDDENLSHCVKKPNTRYLERLIINAEYVSTVQRPNEDHVSHRLYQISMPPQYVAFDQKGTFHCADVSGKFYVFVGGTCFIKNVIRISELICLPVCGLE